MCTANFTAKEWCTAHWALPAAAAAAAAAAGSLPLPTIPPHPSLSLSMRMPFTARERLLARRTV